MLRLVHHGKAMPHSFICAPSAEFQPGCIAQLSIQSNQVMVDVSNGTAPLGIIDDIRVKAFTGVSWNETVIVPATGVMSSGQLVTPIDIAKELKKPSIIASSFVSTVPVVLNSNNGVITFIAGTPLNFDLTGSGTANAIKALVSYTYYIANIPGDDSVGASGRVTIWYEKMFFQTDQFETNMPYPVNANLFCNEVGLLTTRQVTSKHPCIALVTAPPSPLSPLLECMWL
jgi:hypothetical protein